MDDIMVSVYCLAYQHEKYIRQTLEGFVNQVTEFKYEVIVHDDASSDTTAEIIREFAERFPDIIVPVLQKENQYSKHISIVGKHILPLLSGKYIAICEGDDYWTDRYKLSKQVNAMESNQNCTLCVHSVKEVNERGQSTGRHYPNFFIESGIINDEKSMQYCMGYNFHTSSYMVKGADFRDYYINPPAFRKGCPVGDVPMLLYFGGIGKVYYINETMSCYRRGVPTSATVRQFKFNSEEKLSYANKLVKMYQLFDEYTENCYHDECMNRVAIYKASIAIYCKSEKQLIKEKEMFKRLGTKRKLFLFFGCLFPLSAKYLYERRLHYIAKKDHLK